MMASLLSMPQPWASSNTQSPCSTGRNPLSNILFITLVQCSATFPFNVFQSSNVFIKKVITF